MRVLLASAILLSSCADIDIRPPNPIGQLMVTAPADGDYKYAPVPKPLQGKRALACVGITYTVGDEANAYMTADRCKKVAASVAKFYAFNSRGLLQLQPFGYHMDYAGNAWKTFSAAEQVAKKTFKADYYIIPSLFRKGGNHASGGIAHVIQLTGWVVNHEVGHLLGFGHTGSYSYNKAGVPVYNQYGDRESVMGGGGVGSGYFSPPQYYLKGWLPQKEAAQYQPEVPGKVYELKRVSDFKGEGLTVVVIPPKVKGGRQAFVGFPLRCKGACFTLYLASAGGSSIVGSSAKELYDTHFTGLHIKVVGSTARTVKVTIDEAAPPAPVAQAPSEDVLPEEVSVL